MAASVDITGDLQTAIQAAVQPKLMENGWVVEENDTTLSEYVTMMIVNGKDVAGVKSELGGDLLGVGENDPGVGQFAEWLFNTVQQLSAPQQQEQMAEAPQQDQQLQQIPSTQDAQMEDSTASADAPPTGPRSMRNGNERGRGPRMMRQLNNSMGRPSDLPDKLSRIKGAAGVGAGRIDSHRGRDSAPRGPRNNSITHGLQRVMGTGRGGHQNGANGNFMNGGQIRADQQMQFMQMMEVQASMVAQLLQQQNGGLPQTGRGGHPQRGAGRGRGRGGARGGGNQNPALHAVDGKLPDGPLPSGPNGSGMDIDGNNGHSTDAFSTACKYNTTCNVPTCPFAHQSPAVTSNIQVDLTDTCTHRVACTNTKCTARHPSPALRNGHHAGGGLSSIDCKFYPNCANPRCPYRHPTAMPCRNGPDCTTPGCTFAHAKIMCRYNPCTNALCAFKHAEGQKRGKFTDKVWTPEGGEKTDRFADLSKHNEGDEELIRPDQQTNGEGAREQQQESVVPDSQMAELAEVV
ncbi:Nuclear polyadenylated RNA-binding protein NAB2 [Fulvia fulva]|uniref:Nuclear polyadenylated RNA-binding protein NAB2 n=1 Tax=Passalora fulva TaxID=5499 RepID=A0A9Q8PFD4_PASFU|nr:Nuclear polyadenylated RNA-binding protein NAB2 [Fulvia fulva]KAK4613710.1 Nuclear polyadenylated RNA-binding protein NAB2 [Fulvia fulva]KAK4614652.1 Nuclear polyadenylated RNA-binding protein NAB2 [Fulvia fulva]UJO21569.1 Nuclear polyadenylated RNA-binding protein NAB2 [Fulvia fulva]WPV19994.1 Nuclear polyadenylated RNA-binding protein NAB2 [Fulvia fulva]WPV35636.1 Nuclear polyadenylated RNA-binding protein NAB2 [Fulvia fulva]